MHRLAKDALDDLVAVVKQAAMTSTCANTRIEDWLRNFTDKLSGSLALDFNELKSLVVMDHEGVLEFFARQFLKAFEDNLDGYLDNNPKITSVSDWDSNDPAVILRDRIAGCCKQCPFCKEQCEYSENHGGDHRCPLHRSLCLGGWRSSVTGEMTIEICVDLIGCEDRRFYPYATSGQLVHYTKYRDAGGDYSNWEIPGRKGATSDPYWKWFIYRFKDDLKNHFSFQINNIPSDWRFAEKEDARTSIRSFL
jgi:hypothetical protein